METEPNFEDVLNAAVANDATDAAAPEPTADTDDLFAALLAGDESVAPVEPGAPGEESPDGEDAEELLAAEDGDGIETEDDEDADEESEFDRIRRERDELLQAKRETDAQIAEQRAAAHWNGKRGEVDNRLRDALVWLDAEVKSGRHYDTSEFIMRELPTIIEGYTHDLQTYFGEREQAAMQIARQHGTVTWLASLEQRFALSKSEAQRVAKYPPEFMEQAAQDIADARSSADPVKAELTNTKRTLTNTKKALDRATGRARRGNEIRPSPVATASLRDVQARITPDNADEIAGSLFAAIGLTPQRYG